jgi:hypothetical protein
MARRRKRADADDDEADWRSPAESVEWNGAREPARGGLRRGIRRVVMLAGVVAAVAAAPAALTRTGLRDWPLAEAFHGIDGSVSSRSASAGWFGRIDYRGVVFREAGGREALAIERLSLDRGLLRLLWDHVVAARFSSSRPAIGSIGLTGISGSLEVREGGSNLEDLFLPWLTAKPSGPVPSGSVEIGDGRLTIIDLARREAWRIEGLAAAGPIGDDRAIDGWTVAGRLVHASVGNEPVAPPPVRPEGPGPRLSIAAAATAALARDGGWSVTVPVDPEVVRSVTLATNRLPLGVTSLLGTRLGWTDVLDGLADLRLVVQLPQPDDDGKRAWRVTGTVAGSDVALVDAASLRDRIVLESLEAPIDLSLDETGVVIRTLRVRSPLVRGEASGRFDLPRRGSWEWLEQLAQSDFGASAEIDLAVAARSLPGGLAVRPDVRVTGGQLQFAAAAYADGAERVVELRTASRDLTALQGERRLAWKEPFTAWIRGRTPPGDQRLRIEEARIASPAVELTASGDPESAVAEWTVDLDRLVREASEVLDATGGELAGTCRGRLELSRPRGSVPYSFSATASLAGLIVKLPGGQRVSESKVAVHVTGTGGPTVGGLFVDDAHAMLSADGDALDVSLAGGAALDLRRLWDGSPGLIRPGSASQSLTADVSLRGDLGRWQKRLAAAVPTLGSDEAARAEFSGQGIASASISALGDLWRVDRASLEVEDAAIDRGGHTIREPRLVASGTGRFHQTEGLIEVSSAEVLTSTVSLRTGGLTMAFGHPAAGGSLAAAVAGTRGRLSWQTDLGRLEKWIASPIESAAWPLGGRVWGTVEVMETPRGTNLRIEATGDQLTLSSVPVSAALGIGGGASATEVWREPKAEMVLEVTGTRSGGIVVDRLALDSSTAAIQAAGGVGDPSTRRFFELSGSIAYDLGAVSRLVLPWTGGGITLAGSGSRPFTVRGALDDLRRPRIPTAQGALPASPGADAGLPDGPSPSPLVNGGLSRSPLVDGGLSRSPLQTDWLGAIRGTDSVGSTATGRAAIAVSSVRSPGSNPVAGIRSADGPLGWLRLLSLETSLSWNAGSLHGLPLAPADVPVRLLDGQLAFGPFEIGLAGGRVRSGPWVRLVPEPIEVIVPPGRILERIDLSGGACDRWIGWVAPLLARSTRTSGLVSVDTAGATLPVGDPFGGRFDAQVLFESLEVEPGPPAQPLTALVGRLQGLLDPRFTAGQKVVLMRVRPQPVRVWLQDRRIWHDGLVMETGQMVVKTSGSVAADGTLAMMAEMSFRGDIAGQTPVIATLLKTPILVPLKGTIQRPQFDAAAIDKIVARIVENTAGAVIGEGLGRGLEALFGNPQPPKPAPTR